MHECVWWRKGIAEHVHGGILQCLFWPWECRDEPGQDFSDIRDTFILMVYWYFFGKCSQLWRSLIWRPLRKSLIFRKLQEIFPLETDVLTGQTSSFPIPATAVRRYMGKERQATRGQKITEEVPAFSCPPGPLCPHRLAQYPEIFVSPETIKLFLLEVIGSEASTYGNGLLPQSEGNTDIWKDRLIAWS